MLAVVQQTISVTAPVFSMLFLGVALKRLGLLIRPLSTPRLRWCLAARCPLCCFSGL
jgi:hypothetical protein